MIRIDKLLFFLRIARSRAVAQTLIASGAVRMNGRRVEKPGTTASIGAWLTLNLSAGTGGSYADRIRVIQLLAIPHRRGPATEARACYSEQSDTQALDGDGQGGIAGG